ncbi:cobalt/nickel transport protein [Methanomicrobium sp. W14]|uniref:energy-coupling factor ABC transporter substrate-binding protein n=1 Tax=Methanomicrobium sp. W14 TaxID=2817839 RepID=UPI001AE118B9|nr:cobalt transport protein CbiN [Methanomicrobium sp. W14]MBP2132760.1 cobalt/nickel transport protein [Methanomicrobium sp. W14]
MKYKIEILTLVAVIIFIAMFAYLNAQMSAEGVEGWAGSDDVGSEMIESLGYHPWIDNSDYTFVPPSGEIESCLFALQAAFGGLLIGYVFGAWGAERRLKKNSN